MVSRSSKLVFPLAVVVVKKQSEVEDVTGKRVDSVHSSNGITSSPNMSFLPPEGVLLGHVDILGHCGWVEVSPLVRFLLGIESEKGSQLCLSALLHNFVLFTSNKHHMLLVFQMQPEHLDRGLVLSNWKSLQLPAGFTGTDRAHIFIVTDLITYPITLYLKSECKTTMLKLY